MIGAVLKLQRACCLFLLGPTESGRSDNGCGIRGNWGKNRASLPGLMYEMTTQAIMCENKNLLKSTQRQRTLSSDTQYFNKPA